MYARFSYTEEREVIIRGRSTLRVYIRVYISYVLVHEKIRNLEELEKIRGKSVSLKHSNRIYNK